MCSRGDGVYAIDGMSLFFMLLSLFCFTDSYKLESLAIILRLATGYNSFRTVIFWRIEKTRFIHYNIADSRTKQLVPSTYCGERNAYLTVTFAS